MKKPCVNLIGQKINWNITWCSGNSTVVFYSRLIIKCLGGGSKLGHTEIISIGQHSFMSAAFSAPAKSKYLFIFPFSFLFILWSAGTAKSTKWQVFFVLTQGLVFWLRLNDPLESQRILGRPFSRTDSDLYICYLSAWANFSLFHNSQWITFSTSSYYAFFLLVRIVWHNGQGKPSPNSERSNLRFIPH